MSRILSVFVVACATALISCQSIDDKEVSKDNSPDVSTSVTAKTAKLNNPGKSKIEQKEKLNPVLKPYLQLEGTTKAIAEKCRAATVGIMTKGSRSMGSGVIVNKDGLIMTAAHVTRQAGLDVTVFMPDGRRLKGKSLGLDYDSDAGLVKLINVENEEFPYMELGKSAALKKGQFCLAMGHAGGVMKNRKAPLRLGRILVNGKGDKMTNNIISDATVISGDSGGPLFDIEGRVIGINSAIGSSYSINRHVPVDVFHEHWQAFLEGKTLGKFVDYSKKHKKNAQGNAKANDFAKLFQQKIKEKDPEALKYYAAAKKNGGKLNITQSQQQSLIEKWGLKKSQTAKKSPAKKNIFNFDKKKMDPKLLKELEKYSKVGPDGKMKLHVDAGNIDKVRPLLKKLGMEKQVIESVKKSNIGASIHGKGAKQLLSKFKTQTVGQADSVVKVLKDGKQVALGTVISKGGFVLTKASEVYLGELTCKIGKKVYPAEFIKSNNLYDVALLKVEASNLTPVIWAESNDKLGSWLLSPDESGQVTALGILGHDKHRVSRKGATVMSNTNKVFLGVVLNHAENTTEILEVIDGGSAKDAGILKGDKILAINDQSLNTSQEVVEEIGKYKADDVIDIKILRNNEELILKSTLSPRKVQISELRKETLEKLSMRGGTISKRNSAFPLVFTHDGILQAYQCGGPVLNLKGQVIGLNIARVNRTATYAIPSKVVKDLIEDFLN